MATKNQIKLVTVEEANALFRSPVRLAFLRDLRASILRNQAQIEIEEMTASDPDGQLSPPAQAAVTKLMELQDQTGIRGKAGRTVPSRRPIEGLGCGIDRFLQPPGSQIVFLCWKEGEDEITHWHTLQGGLRRKPL